CARLLRYNYTLDYW
nr:immunoglobulin heavy chain junction region [Mus musculus]